MLNRKSIQQIDVKCTYRLLMSGKIQHINEKEIKETKSNCLYLIFSISASTLLSVRQTIDIFIILLKITEWGPQIAFFDCKNY